ncbi:unnamed protein product [Sphenostylis stenocarpa]|uniref:Uncharacterized protein n=1 Tax=Sphenostylis stenocarpa TaxID=92480 RepID=A0AA86TLK8_9FABA|nr:unnamed protein product [Sphenostylis stenocarpa]
MNASKNTAERETKKRVPGVARKSYRHQLAQGVGVHMKKGKRLAKNRHSQVDGNSINRAKPSLKEASVSPRKATSEDLCLI